MLEFIAAALLAGWLTGVMSAYTMHGFIHILLVVAVVVVVVRVIDGQRSA